MEDMASKITELLEDDKSVDMLKNFAGMLKPKASEENSKAAAGPDISKIMQLASGMQEDDRMRLIKALRPFVSEHKRESLDSISNILRIIQLMSLMGNDFKLF